MTEINAELIKKIADLAHIDLKEEEISFYKEKLGQILAFVSTLGDEPLTSTSNLEKTFALGPKSCPFRKDEIKPWGDLTEVMAQAPEKVGTAFQVPRVFES